MFRANSKSLILKHKAATNPTLRFNPPKPVTAGQSPHSFSRCSTASPTKSPPIIVDVSTAPKSSFEPASGKENRKLDPLNCSDLTSPPYASPSPPERQCRSFELVATPSLPQLNLHNEPFASAPPLSHSTPHTLTPVVVVPDSVDSTTPITPPIILPSENRPGTPPQPNSHDAATATAPTITALDDEDDVADSAEEDCCSMAQLPSADKAGPKFVEQFHERRKRRLLHKWIDLLNIPPPESPFVAPSSIPPTSSLSGIQQPLGDFATRSHTSISPILKQSTTIDLTTDMDEDDASLEANEESPAKHSMEETDDPESSLDLCELDENNERHSESLLQPVRRRRLKRTISDVKLSSSPSDEADEDDTTDGENNVVCEPDPFACYVSISCESIAAEALKPTNTSPMEVDGDQDLPPTLRPALPPRARPHELPCDTVVVDVDAKAAGKEERKRQKVLSWLSLSDSESETEDTPQRPITPPKLQRTQANTDSEKLAKKRKLDELAAKYVVHSDEDGEDEKDGLQWQSSKRRRLTTHPERRLDDEIEEFTQDWEATPKPPPPSQKKDPRKFYELFNRSFRTKSPASSQAEGPPPEPLVLSAGDEATGKQPVQVPGKLNAQLRDYQRDGIRFLWKLYSEGKGGILADDMGLGKSLQVIAFLSAVFGKGIGTNVCTYGPQAARANRKRAMIVAPASVLAQWLQEFQKWGKYLPGTEWRFRVEIFHGSPKERKAALGAMGPHGRSEVLITSYETFRKSFAELETIPWDCMFFDEAHRLKDRKSKICQACMEIKTPRRYALTGTVMQNNLEEMWTLVNWAQPGVLDSLDSFRTAFIHPIRNGQRRNASNLELGLGRRASRMLANKIKGLILRRTKDIIKDQLPEKEDTIVFCPLSELQSEAYKRALQREEYVQLAHRDDPCTCGSKLARGMCCYAKTKSGESIDDLLLSALIRLEKLANHLALLKPQPKDDARKQEADKEFLQSVLGDRMDEFNTLCQKRQHELLCGKMRTLALLLPKWQAQKSKVLLFSKSTRILDLLEEYLKKQRYSCCRLDGNTPIHRRQAIIDQFTVNPHKFIFLISTKAGGLGLNLTAANIVVVFDPNWNASHDLQAQDRAYRIGQTKDTHVYRLVAAGTVEEMMYNRQIYKQQLSSIALHGKNERRYFVGVQGVKGQEGELFGAANLFKYTEHPITNEIIQETLRMEKEHSASTTGDSSTTTTTTTTTTTPATTTSTTSASANSGNNEENEDRSAMGMLFQHLADPNGKDEDDIPPAPTENDELTRLLRSAGVSYFHKHTEVLGESEIEKKLSELAEQEAARFEAQAPTEPAYSNIFLGAHYPGLSGTHPPYSGPNLGIPASQTHSVLHTAGRLPGVYYPPHINMPVAYADTPSSNIGGNRPTALRAQDLPAPPVPPVHLSPSTLRTQEPLPPQVHISREFIPDLMSKMLRRPPTPQARMVPPAPQQQPILPVPSIPPKQTMPPVLSTANPLQIDLTKEATDE